MRCSKVPCGSLYKCPLYYCIDWKLVCDGVWDCPRGTDEVSCTTRDCSGLFSCPHSSICILATSLCDSICDCPFHHDEIFCDVRHCASNCDCVGYNIYCRNLMITETFYKMNFSAYRYIKILNSKVTVPLLPFEKMKYIKLIDLSGNNLNGICSASFYIPTDVNFFNLGQNLIRNIKKRCFNSLKVEHLNFELNNVKHINDEAFYYQITTISINFDRNKIEHLKAASFVRLDHLKHVSFLLNNMKSIDRDFLSLGSLVSINIDSISLCCQYKTINKWCGQQNVSTNNCQMKYTIGASLTCLLFGVTELVVHLLICFLYLKGYIQNAIQINSYSVLLIGMHINGAQYGISLVLNFLVWNRNEYKTFYYIILADNKPSNLCSAASFFSMNFILLSTVTQILISATRYEAVKHPFATEIKSSSFARKVVVLSFIICTLVSISMTMLFISTKFDSFHSNYFCSLLSTVLQESTITFELTFYFAMGLYIAALVLVNPLYILLFKETVTQSLSNNTIDSTKRKRRLFARISCLLVLNNSFWITSCILLILLKFQYINNGWTIPHMSILVPINDLINIPILSKTDIFTN